MSVVFCKSFRKRKKKNKTVEDSSRHQLNFPILVVHDRSFHFFFFFPEKGDVGEKVVNQGKTRVKIESEKSKNMKLVGERERVCLKPEMESTNSPLMKSLVNLMVGILTKDSKLSLE